MAEVGNQEVEEISTSESLPPVSERLDKIVVLDQEYRGANFNPESLNPELDRKNREEVQKMIDAGELSSPDDYRSASLIFQHGETSDDFSKAFELSLKSTKLGMPPFATLLAQSFDRLIISLQQNKGIQNSEIKQRFGTQIMHEGTPYALDGQTNKKDLELLAPNLVEGFSDKKPDEQQQVYQKLQSEWQGLSQGAKDETLNRIKNDLTQVKQSYS